MLFKTFRETSGVDYLDQELEETAAGISETNNAMVNILHVEL
jgi:hypothetical protein